MRISMPNQPNFKSSISGLVVISVLLFLILFAAGELSGWAQVGDKNPPLITGIKIEPTSATAVKVRWQTDENADAMVNYGVNKNFGTKRDPLPTKLDHEIAVEDLDPATQYFFRIISSDAFGNQSISPDFSFVTPGQLKESNKIASDEQRALTERAAVILEKVTDPEALKVLASKVSEVAEKILQPPVISGAPKVESGSDFAVVTWNTDQESDSMVAFVLDSGFNPDSDDPYTTHQGNPEELVINHEVRVEGLRPATKYHFQVSSKSELGLIGRSEDFTFTTKAILPTISDISVKKVEEDSATINFLTTIPASAIVEYTDLNSGETKLEGNTAFLTNHSIRLNGLKFATPYSAIIKVENEIGDKVVSDPVTFITVKDVLPPTISNVKNESTLYPGADAKIQTIISWDTDEPSTCLSFYHQGLISAVKPDSFSEEGNFTTRHVQVVTVFVPSTVYKFWLVCKDDTENEAKSEDFVLLTPEKEKNIIDIILENFQGTFGWVQNIGK